MSPSRILTATLLVTVGFVTTPTVYAAEDPCRVSINVPTNAEPGQSQGLAEPSPSAPSAQPTSDPDFVDVPELRRHDLITAVLSPTGQPRQATIASNLTARDWPEGEVRNPTSLVDIRYVDRWGSPAIEETEALIPIGGLGVTTAVTEAEFTKPLPIGLHAQYWQGREETGTNPAFFLGDDGVFSTKYRVTNTVFADQLVPYQDASGRSHVEKVPVFAPFAGYLTVTLPLGGAVLDAPLATISVDDLGRQTLTWRVVAYPPLGSYQNDYSVRWRTNAFAIPSVILDVHALTTDQDPAAAFSVDLLTKLDAGDRELAEGLTEVSYYLGQLAVGLDELTSGLGDFDLGAREVRCYVDRAVSSLLEIEESIEAVSDPELRDALAMARGDLQVLRADVDRVAADVDKAYEGSEELDRGAYELQRRGVDRILDKLVSTSKEPALALAYLTAANAEAPSAMPYPLPASAVGSATYRYTIEEVDESPWTGPAWFAVIGLFVMAGAVTMVLRARSGPTDSPASSGVQPRA